PLTFTLADRARMARAVHETFAYDQGATALARATFPPIDIQCIKSGFAVDVHVQRVERRPAGLQRVGQHRGGLGEYEFGLLLRQPSGRPRTVNPRPPQRLVGVDVADPAHQRLIQQRALDLGALRAHGPGYAGQVERRVHRIARDVGDARRHHVPVDLDQLVQQEPTERPLIDEPQLARRAGVFVQVQPNAQVLLVRDTRRLHEHLPAHAQVADDGFARGQLQPQVLAAPSHGFDTLPGQAPGEVDRPENMPPYRTLVQHVDAANRAATDVLGQPATDGLDFGKLGHAGRLLPAGAALRGLLLIVVGLLALRGLLLGRQRPPGHLRGILLGLLLRGAAALATRLTADQHRRGELLLVVRTGVHHPVLRHAERRGRGQLLQAGLPVQAGTSQRRLRQQIVEQPVHQRTRDLDAVLQIHRADDRF